MRYIYCFFTITLLLSLKLIAQNKTAVQFQLELNQQYSNEEESPLSKKDLKNFKELPFYEIDSNYTIKATFIKSKKTKTKQINTSKSTTVDYDIFGVITFVLFEIEYSLNVYQSHKLRETEAYKNYLFLPFTDATNSSETYGGGRYIDLEIPNGNEIIIDFNQAYNPYCAYSEQYACPIPPKENDLPIEIKAGIKYKAKAD